MKNNFDKPVFIVGSPKSGTSILGRILEKHPDLAYIMEPRMIWKYGNDSKSDILKKEDATEEVKNYIRKKMGEVIEKSSGSRLLDKSPNNALRIPFLLEIFPNAKIIHIVRDGYEASLSIKSHWLKSGKKLQHTAIGTTESILMRRIKEINWRQIPHYAGEFATRLMPSPKKEGKPKALWGVRLPGMRKMLNDLELIEVCALQWKFCVELGCSDGKKLSSDIYREYRLEDLDTETIHDMLEFAELSPNQAVFDYYNEFFTDKRAAWRKEKASKKELELIGRLIEPTRNWLGYK